MDARSCLRTVDVLTDEAVVEARSRLNPAAGEMLSALWVAPTGQLVVIVHHLAVDGVSWRILLEDLNLAWAQHRAGQPVHLAGAPGLRFSGGRRAADRARHAPRGVAQADTWRRDHGGTGAVAGGATRTQTPMPTPGSLSVELDLETTRMLLGEVPAAFHAGINDILLIGFALACAEFTGHRRCADRASTSKATAATRNWPAMSTCRARWGGSPPSTRWR